MEKASTGAAGEISESAPIPRIGEIWIRQGGILVGNVRGGSGLPDYHLIVPPAALRKLKGPWDPRKFVEGADSECDGMVNTLAMVAAGSELAKQARALTFEGHDDYYIAAPREAAVMRANCPDLYEGWCWTSRHYAGNDDYAWIQNFGSGTQYCGHKSSSSPALLARRVPIR